MATLASPTSPSPTFLPGQLLLQVSSSSLQDLLLRRSPASSDRQPPSQLAVGKAALLRSPPKPGRGGQTNALPPVSLAAASPRKGNGGQTNALTATVSLAAAPPRKGNGPKTNAVLDQVKPRGGGALGRPAPPGGAAGPREGSGGRGGVVHAVGPQRPASPPAEGPGGNGGAVHAASY